MGFSGKWRKWIHGCLTSSRASILVNGSPIDEYSITKGLNIAIKSASQQLLIKGLKLPNNGPCLTHLFYADDAIFIGKWDRRSIKNLDCILKCFHISSSLKVNFHKSKLFGIGVTDEELQDQASLLGCVKGYFPFTYLGIPVGANTSLTKNWRPIIEKFQARLSLWKAKTLSFGGHLTLVKSVLNSLPTYYFSLFKAPNGVIEDLEKAQTQETNYVYGEKSIPGVWSNIAKMVNIFPEVHINHQSFFSMVPGSNVEILFWLDRWCGDDTLKSKFPLLYKLELVKRCFVTERVSDSRFIWCWKSLLRGNNVLSEFLELCSILNNIRITPNVMGFRFNLNADGIYIHGEHIKEET
ncbi:uncharacterized protein LOC122195423 [Lactuca sativa]|uniref:uncharacterized protein LOC122195423 n=1 Tax=Lactuca sativa TaxID=4236 RepID=UPI001C687D10|nr:uncharacterized protein LOC122195423 [Lactuca sativa]